MSVGVHQPDEPFASARLLIGLLVTVVFGLLAMRPIYSGDYWWHLAMGRAALEAGAAVFPEPLGLGSIATYVNNVWLFDILLYGLHQLAGPGATNLLVALLAALSFLACWALAREFAGPGAGWTSLLVAALATGGAHLRFTTRPQSFFLLLLPMVLWLSRRAAAGSGRRRWVSLAALIVVVGLWAHLHSSIIIAPVVALAATLPWVLRWSPLRVERAFPVPDRRFWLILATLAILPWTSADGPQIFDRIVGHTDSDVMAYNEEMMPLELEQWLPPSRDFLILEILLVLGCVGFLHHRRIDVGPLLLVLFGLALTVKSNRFVAAWAILAIPWVVSMLRPVKRESHIRVGLTLVALNAVCIFLAWHSEAPSLQTSPVFPVGGAQALAALDVRGPIFNEYSDGGYLGWKLYGQVRLITDSRSITAFDREEEYAARRALSDPRVFDRLAAAHDFQAVLIPRRSPLCSALADRSDWQAIWFAENDVLFLPATEEPMSPILAPCDRERNIRDCRETTAAPFLGEVDKMLRLTPQEAFLGRLGALLALQCARPPAVERALGYLRGPAADEPDHPDLLWLMAMTAVVNGDPGNALALVSQLPEYHHAGQLLRLRLLRRFDRAEEALPIAREQVQRRLDESPPELREQLAWACEETGDLDCAVLQALRASLAGHPGAISRLSRYRQEGKIPGNLVALAEAALAASASPTVR